MNKKICYSEIAYVLGILFIALGTVFIVAADFGVSMIVAPAYLIHLKLENVLPFFSFGMAEYTFQAILLLIMFIVLRKVKLSYFFSFVTAVIYGITLDGLTTITNYIPMESMIVRCIMFVGGLNICACGVAFMFHTYIAPEVYELFVKEVSQKYQYDISKFKTVYDLVSCLVAVVMSFLFFGFGKFRGIEIGTVISACLNGFLIGRYSKMLDKLFVFKDAFRKSSSDPIESYNAPNEEI